MTPLLKRTHAHTPTTSSPSCVQHTLPHATQSRATSFPAPNTTTRHTPSIYRQHRQVHTCSSNGRSRLHTQAATTAYPPAEVVKALPTEAPTDIEYDAVIIGSGMGGLTTASQLVAKGAKVVVLEKYLIPGGSAGHFKREGYTFDVGSSMMFGFGDKGTTDLLTRYSMALRRHKKRPLVCTHNSQGTTNLLTRCLAALDKKIDTVADPTQVYYHLPASEAHPNGLDVQVWRKYEDFIQELGDRFPHERAGIKSFYDESWTIFNALNTLELKSLEEIRYLMGEFVQHPLECLTLALYTTVNVAGVARKFVSDPELLRFIDLECYIWSTVSADLTPMMNAGMVFSDRHYGGINYPVGGVGRLPELLAEGLIERGSHMVYKANVKKIITEKKEEGVRAVAVQLADGRVFKGKTIISNATRWDTFENMIPSEEVPESEVQFKERYKLAPSFFSMHLGVNAQALERPGGTVDCHHVLVDDWEKMEDEYGTIFVSMPSLLDPSLAPAGKHIVHAFTPDWIHNWQSLPVDEYESKKERIAYELIDRLEKILPGLKENIVFREIGTPRTHRRFLNRVGGTYGPIPTRPPLGMMSMPFNKTSMESLYCVGDSTFPGQGVNAVVFSGFGCAHRVAVDIGIEPAWPVADKIFNNFLEWVRDKA